MKYVKKYRKVVELDHEDFVVDFNIEGEPNTWEVQGWEDLIVTNVEPVCSFEEMVLIECELNNISDFDQYEID